MSSGCQSILIAAGLTIGVTASVSAATPEEIAALVNQPVELVLTDGRKPRGLLSAKSGEEWIVLQTDLPEIVIESRFAARVVQSLQAVTGPRPQSPDLPIPPAPELGASIPSEAVIPARDFPCMSSCSWEPITPIDSSRLFPAMNRLEAPRSLCITTVVANWDADPEVDGLLLRVQPFNGWGQMTAVDGELDVQLVTETRLVTGGRIIPRSDPFPITERWSVPIRALAFDAEGLVVKLPFRRFHPERDVDIAPDALAVARLRIPTVGTLDASDANVVLRPTSRFRDDLFELRNNRRHFVEGPLH